MDKEKSSPKKGWKKILSLYTLEFGLFFMGIFAVYWFVLRVPFTGFLHQNDFKVEFDSGYGNDVANIEDILLDFHNVISQKATHSAKATFNFTDNITTDNIYQIFPKRVEYLLVLELNFQTYIQTKAVEALIESLPSTLSKLKLSLNTTSYNQTIWKRFVEIVKKMQNLKQLSLGIHDYDLDDTNIFSQLKLSSLDLAFVSNNVTGESLINLAKLINHHQKLQEVRLYVQSDKLNSTQLINSLTILCLNQRITEVSTAIQENQVIIRGLYDRSELPRQRVRLQKFQFNQSIDLDGNFHKLGETIKKKHKKIRDLSISYPNFEDIEGFVTQVLEIQNFLKRICFKFNINNTRHFSNLTKLLIKTQAKSIDLDIALDGMVTDQQMAISIKNIERILQSQQKILYLNLTGVLLTKQLHIKMISLFSAHPQRLVLPEHLLSQQTISQNSNVQNKINVNQGSNRTFEPQPNTQVLQKDSDKSIKSKNSKNKTSSGLNYRVANKLSKKFEHKQKKLQLKQQIEEQKNIQTLEQQKNQKDSEEIVVTKPPKKSANRKNQLQQYAEKLKQCHNQNRRLRKVNQLLLVQKNIEIKKVTQKTVIQAEAQYKPQKQSVNQTIQQNQKNQFNQPETNQHNAQEHPQQQGIKVLFLTSKQFEDFSLNKEQIADLPENTWVQLNYVILEESGNPEQQNTSSDFNYDQMCRIFQNLYDDLQEDQGEKDVDDQQIAQYKEQETTKQKQGKRYPRRQKKKKPNEEYLKQALLQGAIKDKSKIRIKKKYAKKPKKG